MRILMVSAECAPLAKTGGLGDVVHGLSRALIERGAEARVLLPAYDHLDPGACREILPDLQVRFDDTWIPCRTAETRIDGIPCRLIAPRSEPDYFRRGRIYGEPDDAERFAFFCRAALADLARAAPSSIPDIVHCHDWHTGLLPVLLRRDEAASGLADIGICYSLHNLGYQGVVPASLLRKAGLDPDPLMSDELLRQPGAPDLANLMRGGILFADAINTVSPRHAWEALHTEQGMGLQALLRARRDRFGGILNGIDDRVWNPAADPLIAAPYDLDHLPGKLINRRALRRRLGLAEADRPILAIVSRLDRQKGEGLIRDGIRLALARGAQAALLGTALEPAIAADFAALARSLEGHPDCRLVLAYDESLAHLIYAGADLILIPSLYEPCGLTQMIAMRYGTVPVARRVGGLADTLEDAHYSAQPFERRNALLFDDPTPEALDFALERAIWLWYRHPDHFRALRVHGMRADRSWRAPAARYLAMYEALRAASPEVSGDSLVGS